MLSRCASGLMTAAIVCATAISVQSVRADYPIGGMNLHVHVCGSDVTVVDPTPAGGGGPITLMYFDKDASWTPIGAGNPVTKCVEVIPRSDGFDMELTLHNPSGAAAELYQLALNNILLTPNISERTFAHNGEPSALVRTTTNARTIGFHQVYPRQSYSPALVISNDLTGSRSVAPIGAAMPSSAAVPNGGFYTMGFSLAYPVRCYKHNVEMNIEHAVHMANGDIDKERNWRVWLQLNPQSVEHSIEGMLAPNETRTYTFHVRVMRHAEGQLGNGWLRTLEPYRQYFKGLYSGVQYARDPRPVATLLVAQSAVDSHNPCHPTDNPYGFDGRFELDDDGFAPLVNYLNNVAFSTTSPGGRGYERSMLWAPTGVYCAAPARTTANFPFLFTSEWQSMPNAASTIHLLPTAFTTPGRSLGLWWGNSAQPVTQWNPTVQTMLDPQDPSSVAMAFTEMDGADDVGAREIGLDAFTELPAWIGYDWLVTLQANYSQRFIFEPVGADLLHSLTPMFMESRRWAYRPNTPHLLADFLLPGHETWDWHSFGTASDEASRQQVVREVAALGYVPSSLSDDRFNIIPTLAHPSSDYNAAETWHSTLAGYRIGCSPADIANDDGSPLFPLNLGAEGVNNGVNEGDYNAWFQGFFVGSPQCDIADDAGNPLPPFNVGPNSVNNGVNEGDYNCFYQHFFNGCITPSLGTPPVGCTAPATCP